MDCRVYVLIDSQASAPCCLPTQHIRAPRAAAAITARVALSTARRCLLKRGGATLASMATVMVRVKKIEMAVLMATIWPNLAKGTMMQKNRGTVEIAVVTALDTMATPTWFTACRVRLCLSAEGSCREKESRQEKQLKKIVTYLNTNMLLNCVPSHDQPQREPADSPPPGADSNPQKIRQGLRGKWPPLLPSPIPASTW